MILRLYSDEAEGRFLPVTSILTTGLPHPSLMQDPALDILHHDVRHQSPHLAVGLAEVPEEGDNLARYVVPVDVLVSLSVGGAHVEGGHQVVEVVVNTIQVTVVCCVDQNCGSCQGIVKSVIGKFLRKLLK